VVAARRQALLVVDTPAGPPPPMGRPEPTDAQLIAQLRADLIAERARTMRMAEYVEEVLEAEFPEDVAVVGWERGEDWQAYWSQRAEEDLRRDDWWRRARWRRLPVPVMGLPEEPTQAAPEVPC